MFTQLTINPGSATTKIGLFIGENFVFKETIEHPVEVLSKYESIVDQMSFRKEAILEILNENQIELNVLDVVVGRGGFLRPLPSGTYLVEEPMLHDLKQAKFGEHASNLGALIAYDIATAYNIPAFIVDPIVVDELIPEARLSGLPDIKRQSNAHALNIKAVARRIAIKLERSLNDLNFVIAHLGSGISIVAHREGKMIDVNNADNEGPFSPERTGGLPLKSLIKLCYSGKYTGDELVNRLTRNGGLFAYLGTKSVEEIVGRISKGDLHAQSVIDGMIYQIAKEIGGMAAVLEGKIDGIILTGGMCYSDYILERLKKKINFLAEIFIVPGEAELEALAQGGYRALNGEEELKYY